MSAIGGGSFNGIADNSQGSTITGGGFNGIGTNSSSSSIGGGFANGIANNSSGATISGGEENTIQGLNQKLTEELKRRDAENAELKARLAHLEKLVTTLATNEAEP